MAPSSRSRSKRSGTLRSYAPPFWRDVMFWIATGLSVAIGVVIVIVLFMLLGLPRSNSGWVWTAGIFLLGSWIGFVVLSLGLNTARGVQRGALEADSARGDRYEAHGRKAGKVVGTGLAKVTGRSKPTSPSSNSSDESDAASAASSETQPQEIPPKPSLDDAARSIGMMIGRRIGARKDQP